MSKTKTVEGLKEALADLREEGQAVLAQRLERGIGELRQMLAAANRRTAEAETTLASVSRQLSESLASLVQQQRKDTQDTATAENQRMTQARLEGIIRQQAARIAELERCPELALPASINLRRLNYGLLERVAGQTVTRNDELFDDMRKELLRLARYHKLTRVESLVASYSRESMIGLLHLGLSEAALWDTITKRPGEIRQVKIRLENKEIPEGEADVTGRN